MEQFSTLDIVRILNIPRERLREWLTRGFIRPSIQQARGQGTKALFSREDLYLVGMFRDLIGSGLSRESASVYAHESKRTEFLRAKYLVLGYEIYRNQTWINTKTGKPDKKKRDARIADVKFIKDEVGLQKLFTSKIPWDHIFIVNLEKLKKEIGPTIG